MTREQQGKYDMATLLFYRLLEMIEQRRLSHYNLNVSKMDYDNIKYNLKNTPEMGQCQKDERFLVLKNKVHAIKQELFGKNAGAYLPEQISLLEGFILLYALEDSIMIGERQGGINQLKRIRAMVYLRNSQFSIQFAVQLIQAYLVRRYHSVNEMCQIYDVSVTTFYQLLHDFKRDWRRMLKLVHKYEKEIEREVLKFAKYSYADMGELLRKFYERYGYNFMCFDGMDST